MNLTDGGSTSFQTRPSPADTGLDEFGVYFDNISCPPSTFHASHSFLDSFMPMAEGVNSHHIEGSEGMGIVSSKAEVDAEVADSVGPESPEQAIEENHQPTSGSPIVESRWYPSILGMKDSRRFQL